MIPPLRPYEESRSELRSRAAEAGASAEEHAHPRRGPAGEPLAMDVARIGPPPGEAEVVVVVASGLHGVEGHAGWGLQMLLLESGRLADLPEGVAVVLVHGVNPYGMAWSRRVDHDNIDVNRNFVDFDGATPANPDYAEIDAILNPVTFDLDDESWRTDLRAFGKRVGRWPAFRAVSGGQYDHPTGVQFGGQGPSWSRSTLEAVWARHLDGARLAVNVDLHTGLGSHGGLLVFQTANEGEPAATLAAAWVPEVWRSDRPEVRPPLQHGVLGPRFDAVAPVTTSVPLVVEFGTHDDMVVLGAMRADNWLHHHGDPSSEIGLMIRERMRDAFFVEDEGWRQTVGEVGMDVIGRVLDGACAQRS